MKRKKKSTLPAIKKNIEAFISEEEGAISKKDAVNLGLSLVLLGAVLTGSAYAQGHASYFDNTGSAGAHHSGPGTHTDHNVHSAHGNHGNHGNHSNAPHGAHYSHSFHSAGGPGDHYSFNF